MNSYNSNSVDGHPGIIDRLFALLLYLLPHHLLSRLVYWITRSEWPLLKNALIQTVIKLYDVEMRLAVEPDPSQYRSFNAFFTRQLRPEVRPLSMEAETVLCPVDGAVSQAGEISNGRIFQAKGQDYSLSELLADDEEWAQKFEDGSFATLYLSPRDYHRIHMPVSGKLRKMLHVPGRLFSVSPSTTRTVPRLFSRNERVINLFDTEMGPVAVILVGAIFVSSMDTVWAGTITPASQRITQWNYPDRPTEPVTLDKGDELGRFNMGSTVILLFGKQVIEWNELLRPGVKVRMGEEIARQPSSETSS